MEKRVGVVAILLERKDEINRIDDILHEHSDIISARQGLPMRDKGIFIISLIVDGTTDRLGSLTGKIGRLNGVKVKSVLTDFKEVNNEGSIIC